MSLRSYPSALFGDARRVSDSGMYYSGVPSVVLSILETAVYHLLIHPSFNEIVCEARESTDRISLFVPAGLSIVGKNGWRPKTSPQPQALTSASTVTYIQQ
jgi:hypothetical protein